MWLIVVLLFYVDQAFDGVTTYMRYASMKLTGNSAN